MSRMPTFPTQRLFGPTSNRLVYVPSAQTDIRITFAKFAQPHNPLRIEDRTETTTRLLAKP